MAGGGGDLAKGGSATQGVMLGREGEAEERWLREKLGVRLDGVGTARFQATGRGCAALRPIKADQVIVTVPDDAVLLANSSIAAPALEEFGLLDGGDGAEGKSESESESESEPSDGSESLDGSEGSEEGDDEPNPRLEKEALVLAVMAEIAAGKQSKWHSYLASLPELDALHSPLGWSAAQLARLEGTSVLTNLSEPPSDAIELPTMTNDHWETVAKPFLDQFGAQLNLGGLPEDELKARYLRSTALVAGYSFTLGDSELQGMVPYWDFLNHRSPEGASVVLSHDEKKGELHMMARCDLREGEEVFNT